MDEKIVDVEMAMVLIINILANGKLNRPCKAKADRSVQLTAERGEEVMCMM